MLIEQESDKIKLHEQGYQHELSSWKSNLEPRKQVSHLHLPLVAIKGKNINWSTTVCPLSSFLSAISFQTTDNVECPSAAFFKSLLENLFFIPRSCRRPTTTDII